VRAEIGRYTTFCVHGVQLRNQASDAGDYVFGVGNVLGVLPVTLLRGKAAYRVVGKSFVVIIGTPEWLFACYGVTVKPSCYFLRLLFASFAAASADKALFSAVRRKLAADSNNH